jgi:hypothetical protein
VLQVSDTRKLFLVLAGALAVAFMVNALTASPASAGIIPNPIDAVKGLIGVPGDVAGELGATVLKEALEWLLGGIKTAITLALVKFLTHIELPVGRSLAQVTGPMIVIGGFFLVTGLITSIGDGYREIVAGTDTPPRVIGQAIFRVIGLALLLGAWYWIVPLAVDVANGMSDYVLSDKAVASALRRTFAAEKLLSVGFPLLGLLTAVALAMSILVLVVLKFVLAIAFACLYVGGPAFIGFGALPRVGTLPLAIVTRGLFTLTLIPLLWTIVFVAWAGVSAAMFDTATGDANGAMGALMGPGLFLAGLVVMLAATKKVLSMATFGLRLAVPGTGMARLAVRSATGLAVARVLAGTVNGSAAGGSVADSPRQVGDERRQAEHATFRAERPAAAATQPRRLEVAAPHEAWASRREAERANQQADANAIADVRNGVFRPRQVPSGAAKAMAARVDELRAVWGGEIPPERLLEIQSDLGTGDRAAAAGAARWAMDRHPGDREATRLEFQRTMQNAYAGVHMHPRAREAVETTAAANPEVVWDLFAPDHAAYGGKHPPTASNDQDRPHVEYDSRLMDQHGGLEAFRREAQRRRAQAGPDDEPLPF